MPPFIDAERFRSRFDGVPLHLTGSLIGDIDQLCTVLWHIQRELRGEANVPWFYLDRTDPMETIRRVAAHVELANAELHAQGFRPPDVDYEMDPLSMVEANSRFLWQIRASVAEPARTLN